MSTSLEEFEKTAEVVDAKKLGGTLNNASIYLHKEENEGKGKFVFGKFLLIRSFPKKNGKGDNHFAEIRLIQTNAEATTKQGEKYVPTDVKEGEIVTVMVPSGPKRFLEATEAGSLVKLTYEKLAFVKIKSGARVPSHQFELKRGKGSLTPEDTAYILGRTTKKEESKEAVSTDDADEALGQIEE